MLTEATQDKVITATQLHELGFKTFDGLIDESYDLIQDNNERISAIKTEIRKLCDMTLEQLDEWHHSLSDIYDHNQDLLYQWSCKDRRSRPRRHINKDSVDEEISKLAEGGRVELPRHF